jgi:hypothetical protein
MFSCELRHKKLPDFSWELEMQIAEKKRAEARRLEREI